MIAKNYDILIVGGGLVGASMAVALCNSGYQIGILEKNIPEFKSEIVQNSRPLSLSYGSILFLKKIAVWEALEKFASPILQVHVSEEKRFGFLQFDAKEENVTALGYVVPMMQLQAALYQIISEQGNIDLIAVDEINAIEQINDNVEISYRNAEGAQKGNASLVIVCDGSHSPCRKLLNIEAEEQSWSEVALTAELDLKRKHSHKAFERFSKEGVLAVLPGLSLNTNYLVWSMSETQMQKFKVENFATLEDRVQKIFGDRLGTIQAVKVTGQYPLAKIIAKEIIKGAAVLIGNAAHTLYPIAAQGFNLGLRDVAALSQLLHSENKETMNFANLLSQYQKMRMPDYKSMIQFIDTVDQGFQPYLPLINRLRSKGLLAMDLFSIIKKNVARKTMGLAV